MTEPSIATTVDLLSTGIKIAILKNIVFMRPRSMLFNKIGRGQDCLKERFF